MDVHTRQTSRDPDDGITQELDHADAAIGIALRMHDPNACVVCRENRQLQGGIQ